MDGGGGGWGCGPIAHAPLGSSTEGARQAWCPGEHSVFYILLPPQAAGRFCSLLLCGLATPPPGDPGRLSQILHREEEGFRREKLPRRHPDSKLHETQARLQCMPDLCLHSPAMLYAPEMKRIS